MFLVFINVLFLHRRREEGVDGGGVEGGGGTSFGIPCCSSVFAFPSSLIYVFGVVRNINIFLNTDEFAFPPVDFTGFRSRRQMKHCMVT